MYVKYTKESGFKLCLAPSDFNKELELADTSRYVSNRSGRNAIAYIDEAGHTLCTFDLDTGKKKVLKTLAAGSETLILADENSVVNWGRTPLGCPARLIGDTLFVSAQAYCELWPVLF